MAFFTSAVGVLQTLVIALGAGLGIWGVINLLEGYGNDNPGANGQCPQGSSYPKYEKRQPTDVLYVKRTPHSEVSAFALLYSMDIPSL